MVMIIIIIIMMTRRTDDQEALSGSKSQGPFMRPAPHLHQAYQTSGQKRGAEANSSKILPTSMYMNFG